VLSANQPIILIMDGSPIHRAKIVQEFVDSTNGNLELHFLPPYSPQPNPDEQVWKHVKERVAKQFPKDKFELRVMVSCELNLFIA
jgi:transposase